MSQEEKHKSMDSLPTAPNLLVTALRVGFAAYERVHKLPEYVISAIRLILICRTSALGGHIESCPDGHFHLIRYHSCGHRFCPICGYLRVRDWLRRQQERLLPCDHYHVIFTLPHELNPLWLANVGEMPQVLFTAVRATLFELLEDPKYLGARPGIIAALHTWGQTLVLHPHIHCLVTGGGLSPEGKWMPVATGYLLPIRVVMAVFRGKLLEAIRTALERGALVLPPGVRMQQMLNLLNKLGRQKWNVYIRERCFNVKVVLKYLARYICGGPISPSRLREVPQEAVVFTYKNNQEATGTEPPKRETLRLSLEEFVRRLLLHVPEPGRQMLRHYGLYAGSKKKECEGCRGQLEATRPAEVEEPDGEPDALEPERCPVCGKVLSITHYLPAKPDGRPHHLREVAEMLGGGLEAVLVSAA